MSTLYMHGVITQINSMQPCRDAVAWNANPLSLHLEGESNNQILATNESSVDQAF